MRSLISLALCSLLGCADSPSAGLTDDRGTPLAPEVPADGAAPSPGPGDGGEAQIGDPAPSPSSDPETQGLTEPADPNSGAAQGTQDPPGGAGATTPEPASFFRCPDASAPLALDPGSIQLERVTGLPTNDGFSPGFSILEGPVWYQGALLFSQIASGQGPPPARMLRLQPDGSVRVLLADAGANGLALDPEGRLIGASHQRGGIVRFATDPSEGVREVLVDQHQGARFNSPNDLAVHSAGHLYFTDPDWQAASPRPQQNEQAYMLSASGELSVIEGSPDKPNGVALSLDERSLFVGGSSGLLRFQLTDDGEARQPGERVADIYSGVDGLGRDCDGRLYVTSGSEVVVVDPDGRRVGAIPAPGGEQLTNVAFGGPEGRTLFVTSLGSVPALLRAELPVTGHPY